MKVKNMNYFLLYFQANPSKYFAEFPSTDLQKLYFPECS